MAAMMGTRHYLSRFSWLDGRTFEHSYALQLNFVQ